MKILVLSPHRDDAAFSVGLAIESWLDGGHTVEVMNCFTCSEYAPFSDVEFLHPNERMPRITALRLGEDLRWKRQYGAALTLMDLKLKDAPVRLGCAPTGVCSLPVSSFDAAISNIQQAILRESADALILPLAVGGHVDHKTTREAAKPLLRSTMPYAFYEDLPYAARPGAADTIEGVAHCVDKDLAPVFASEASDLEASVDRKRRAALCYGSQIDDHGIEQIAQYCKRYGGRERLWANPAWLTSDLGGAGIKSHAASR